MPREKSPVTFAPHPSYTWVLASEPPLGPSQVQTTEWAAKREAGEVVAASTVDVQTLVRRAQEQDGQAFSALYELYARKVYAYLYYHLNGHAQEAEDLTADVFIKVFEKIGSYQFRGVPFTAWLFRIAHNHLIDHVRSCPRQPLVPLEAIAELKETATLQELDRRLTIEQLTSALAQLTSEQRQVVILRFIEGLSIADTAQAMGKTEDAVKKLQARGLASLKRVLEREERAVP